MQGSSTSFPNQRVCCAKTWRPMDIAPVPPRSPCFARTFPIDTIMVSWNLYPIIAQLYTLGRLQARLNMNVETALDLSLTDGYKEDVEGSCKLESAFQKLSSRIQWGLPRMRLRRSATSHRRPWLWMEVSNHQRSSTMHRKAFRDSHGG